MSRSSTTTYITVHGDVIRTTDKAVLFKVTGIRDTELEVPFDAKWFPLSQIPKKLTDPEPGKSWLMLPEWIFKEKGLEFPPKADEQLPDYEDIDPDNISF